MPYVKNNLLNTCHDSYGFSNRSMFWKRPLRVSHPSLENSNLNFNNVIKHTKKIDQSNLS